MKCVRAPTIRALDNVEALQTTNAELGMEVEDSKAETEAIVQQIEVLTRENKEMKHDVSSARKRIATAERKQRIAEANRAKEKQKASDLRKKAKNKCDSLRYYEKKSAEAKKEAKVNHDVKALEAELESLRQHCTTLSTRLRDVSSELIEKEEELEQFLDTGRQLQVNGLQLRFGVLENSEHDDQNIVMDEVVANQEGSFDTVEEVHDSDSVDIGEEKVEKEMENKTTQQLQ